MSHPSDGFTGILHPEVKDYLHGLTGLEDSLVFDMEEYAKERKFPLLGRMSGRACELLSRMIGARRVFEFGSGWGYSAFFFARGVGPEGEVIGSEKDEWELDAHLKLFGDHPLAERIHIVHGDAFEVFDSTEGDFDVIFIDIDKAQYPKVIEAALPRLRVGGLILADNTLWGGKVARPAQDASTEAIQRFNKLVNAHPKLQSLVLPLGDGLSVSVRVR